MRSGSTPGLTAAVARQLRERVAGEVQAVMAWAFGGAPPAAPVVAAAQVTAPVEVEAKPAPVETKPAPTASSTCSQPGCPNHWYRPAGKDKKLCYAHFLAAGRTAPPGKKRGTKPGRKR
jgi:hypothetical protein